VTDQLIEVFVREIFETRRKDVIRLDPSSRTPVAEQLRARIAARIERGDLLAGERLPPIRALAVEHGH